MKDKKIFAGILGIAVVIGGFLGFLYQKSSKAKSQEKIAAQKNKQNQEMMTITTEQPKAENNNTQQVQSQPQPQTQQPQAQTNNVSQSQPQLQQQSNLQATKPLPKKQSNYEKSLKKRMDNIEEELEKETDTSTTAGTRDGLNNLYTSWDGELNKVYKMVMDRLPKSEKEKLRNKQRQWIKTRDAKAAKASKEAEGGTMQPVLYVNSKIETTKARTLELARMYDRMK